MTPAAAAAKYLGFSVAAMAHFLRSDVRTFPFSGFGVMIRAAVSVSVSVLRA